MTKSNGKRKSAAARRGAKATAERERAIVLDWIRERAPRPLRDLIDRARGKDILLFAASLAFYALISIVPLLIVTLWITGFVLGEERIHTFARELRTVMPQSIGADQLLGRVTELGTSIGVSAVVGALWPATSYGAGLVRAFDRLSGEQQTLKGLRGRGLLFLVLLPLSVFGTLIASYAGTQVAGSSTLGRVAGLVAALATAFVISAVSLALIYRIFPPRRMSWSGIWRATAFTAAGASILSLLLALYLGFGPEFEQHYAFGGIAGIVLLGVWLFLSNALLLLGFLYGADR